MSDDQYVIRVDRDRDGVAEEQLDPTPPGDGTTEQPPYIDLPPRSHRLTPVGGWDGSSPAHGFHDDQAPTNQPGRRTGAAWAFGVSALGVVLAAGVIAVGATRQVERMDVSEGASTFIGMLVGIACAVGAFLLIARLTRMLRLTASVVGALPVVEPPVNRRIITSAQLDVEFQAALMETLGGAADRHAHCSGKLHVSQQHPLESVHNCVALVALD